MNKAGLRILTFLIWLILINSCAMELPVPSDESTVEQAIWVRLDLDTAQIALGASLRVYKGNREVTEDTWNAFFPDCERPYMKWYLIDVYADTIDKIVKYDRVFSSANGYDMWEWYPCIPKDSAKTIQWGTWYFQVRLTYDSLTPDGIVTREQVSASGTDLLYVSAFYHGGNPIIETAEKYIRVPYVYGWSYDEYGNPVGKTIDDGHFGIDCSGLACYAYNALGEGLDVDTDNTTRLREYYLKPELGIDDVVEGDLIFVNPGGSNHVMIVGPVSADRYRKHFIIHATASTQPERANPDSSWYWDHNNKRSVVIEHLSYRKRWWRQSTLDFKGIGRLPRNSKEITQRRKNMFD